ncbi:hypothetical protein ACQ4PT_027997 [Festuca glaucescens]
MDTYCRPLALIPLLILSLLGASSAATVTTGAPDGSELWGYVEVRPKANLFWWYYKSPQRVSTPSKPWPTVLWLQGGPGASGVGIGNFLEIGPLDVGLNPRNSTWLQKADLIFVDNPVGVGYSYAEDPSLLVKTDWEAAADATALVSSLATQVPALQEGSPFFLVAESYGGKYAATLGVSLARAIRAGQLNLTLGGVALGDSFVSPEDFTLSYAPLLLEVSRLDDNAGDAAKAMAATAQQQIAAGQFYEAWSSWNKLLQFIGSKSARVDVYNFLLDSGMDPVSTTTSSNTHVKKYSRYLSIQEAASDPNAIGGIMNGVVKQKLKIIPSNVTWQELSYKVYSALTSEIMKPRIDELDVICSTSGAEAWVQKLKWDGLKNFTSLPRQPLRCGSSKLTQAFVRSYENLHFYWILGAGHFVPANQPCIALDMIGSITQSPAS